MEDTAIRHIERRADVCGGKPCIAGTRIRVQDVFVWHELQGQSADAIVSQFPQLSMAAVYAALAYFWDHRDAIRQQMEDEATLVDELKQKFPSPLRQKLARKAVQDHPLPPG